jgi:hypothetical protein
MTISSRSIFFLFLFSLLPLVAESSEYMLFSPRPLEGELLMPERGKGVLVRRITIKKGDTLSQISRDFSGKGSYYPQILLFNDIRNPDRIFAGRELMVPISKQDALTKTFPFKKNVSLPVDKSTLRKTKRADMTAVKAAAPVKRKQRTIAKEPLPDKQTPGSESLVNTSEQDAYSKAVSAYDRGEYAMALSLFNRFLERYPSSSRDSDASLYKAECLLKLSDQ